MATSEANDPLGRGGAAVQGGSEVNPSAAMVRWPGPPPHLRLDRVPQTASVRSSSRLRRVRPDREPGLAGGILVLTRQ
jgi:hypothetical protein